VEIRFPSGATGTAGLAVHIQPNEADEKWEWFSGYRVELLPKEQQLVLKRAERAARWKELQKVSCQVPTEQWISLAARIDDNRLAIKVNGTELITVDDEHPLAVGRRGLVARENVIFRNFSGSAPEAGG
jgi:hypothetical protein